jgi:cyclopropane fatty-acyl-phospholipid synthase-like methyltransferase
MLALCEEKARARGLTNIETHCAGFLTHRHNAEPVDAVVSVAALHHLPDFWKAIAVKRIHEMLKPGGKFYLFDVVFPFSVEEFREQLDGWLQGMQNAGGQAMAYATATHIRDEHSTFDWIMTGMLERAGFHIDRTFSDFPLSSAYVCTR